MGARSKADLFNLVERIIELHDNQKLSYKDIEKQLRSEGFNISRESIRRSHKSAKELSKTYVAAVEEAKGLVNVIKENPNTDMLEVTNALMTRHLFNFMRSVDELNFDDSGEVAKAINNLSNAQVRISKYKFDFSKGYEKAKEDILESIKKRLEKEYPDVVKILQKIIKEAGVNE